MGENARRLSDNKTIKIGRGDVNNLFYLRYEDRNKVIAIENSLDPRTIEKIIWRLPLPEEDNLQPGDYDSDQPYICNEKDSRAIYIHPECLLSANINSLFTEFNYRSGIFQMIQPELGLKLNVACHHGLRDNKHTKEVSFAWNGRKKPFSLCGILNDIAEIKICFTCIACGEKWFCSFEELQHFILSEEMKKRLFKLCSEYWEERNPDKDYPYAMTRKTDSGTATISLRRWTNPFRDKYAVSIDTIDDGQTNYYWTLDDAFEDYIKY